MTRTPAPVTEPSARGDVRRLAEAALALVLLVLATPMLVLAAVAVRLSSHGPVLHREPGFDDRGRPVQLLSFRVLVDGGATRAHRELRAVVGAAGRRPLTGVGRVLCATRLDRLPRLLNVAAGRHPLF